MSQAVFRGRRSRRAVHEMIVAAAVTSIERLIVESVRLPWFWKQLLCLPARRTFAGPPIIRWLPDICVRKRMFLMSRSILWSASGISTGGGTCAA